ncbi:MAG TPA: cupredoxin domain-containing protein [Solirubrobacterales bacterium]|nr:cupredoxin domain-containing protein [Solirubrobacterales bacterium]
MKKLTVLALALAAIGLFACGGSDSDDTTSAAGTEATTTAQAENAAEAGNEAESESEAEEGFNPEPTTKDGYPLMDDRTFDSTVRYAADPENTYSYFISEASASPGKISFEFVNPQTTPHNVALEAPNGETIGETETIGYGVTKSNFEVKPGVYTLYCSVPGHRKKGMLGHLTVE